MASSDDYLVGSGCTVLVDGSLRKAKLKRLPTTIYVIDEITTMTAYSFRSELAAAAAAGQPIIPVEISSPGGDVYALLSMVDAITACPVPVATIVTGIAASAAACLFMCGHRDHRYMAPNARLMIHSVSTTFAGTIKTADMAANAAESRRVNDILCNVMARQCGRPASFFSAMIRDKDNTDVYIDAQQALTLGIASSTETPTLVARVSVAVTLETLSGRAVSVDASREPTGPSSASLSLSPLAGTASANLSSTMTRTEHTKRKGESRASRRQVAAHTSAPIVTVAITEPPNATAGAPQVHGGLKQSRRWRSRKQTDRVASQLLSQSRDTVGDMPRMDCARIALEGFPDIPAIATCSSAHANRSGGATLNDGQSVLERALAEAESSGDSRHMPNASSPDGSDGSDGEQEYRRRNTSD